MVKIALGCPVNAFGHALGNSIVFEMQNSKADDEKNTKDINDFLAKKNQESINQFENQLNGNNPTSNPLDPRSHFTPEQLARMKELDSTLTDKEFAAEQKRLTGMSRPIAASKDGRIAKTGGVNEDRFLHTYLNKNGEEVRFRLDELLFSYIQGEENSFGDGLTEFGKTADLFIQQGEEQGLSPIQKSILLEDIAIHRNIVEGGSEALSIAGRYVAFGQVSNVGYSAGKQINKSIVRKGNDQAARAQNVNHQIKSKSLQHTISNKVQLTDVELKNLGLSDNGINAVREGYDLGLGLTRIRGVNPTLLVDFARVNETKIFNAFKGGDLNLFTNPNIDDLAVFDKQLSFALENANNIKFNLDGISDVQAAIKLGSEGAGAQRIVDGFPQGNVTNFELFKIFENEKLLKKTIFFRNGQQIE